MNQCLGFQGAWHWTPGLFGRAMAPKIHIFKRVQSRVQSSPESRSSPGNSASRVFPREDRVALNKRFGLHDHRDMSNANVKRPCYNGSLLLKISEVLGHLQVSLLYFRGLSLIVQLRLNNLCCIKVEIYGLYGP